MNAGEDTSKVVRIEDTGCQSDYQTSLEDAENVSQTRSGLLFKGRLDNKTSSGRDGDFSGYFTAQEELSTPSRKKGGGRNHKSMPEIDEEEEIVFQHNLPSQNSSREVTRSLQERLQWALRERDLAKEAEIKALKASEERHKFHSFEKSEINALKEELEASRAQRELDRMEMIQLRKKLENLQFDRSPLMAKENVPPPIGRSPRTLLKTRASLGKPARSSSLESNSDSSSDRSRLSLRRVKRRFRRPDPFTGSQSESWNSWMTHFERKLAFSGIRDDYEQAFYFSESVKDVALRFFNSNLTEEEQTSWQLCRERFQARFGAPAENARGRSELATMKLKTGESAMAFCQRFVEAWEKVYTSKRVSVSSRDPYMVEQFISAIGDNQAIVHVACQPHDSLEEVCKALQQWLDANSFAGSQKPGKFSRLENRIPDMPVYASEERKENGADILASQLKEFKETAELVQKTLSGSGATGVTSKSKPGKQTGDKVTRLPKWAASYKLVKCPRWGYCWYCGQKEANHTLKTCPKRLKQEKEQPGSSRKQTGESSPVEAEN